jgi:hypothetical protein
MTGLLELSNNHDNLSNDLRIAISELVSPMYSAGVGMNYQAVVLPAAASARIASVALENDVQRLLPHLFRAAVVWRVSFSHDNKQNTPRPIKVSI